MDRCSDVYIKMLKWDGMFATCFLLDIPMRGFPSFRMTYFEKFVVFKYSAFVRTSQLSDCSHYNCNHKILVSLVNVRYYHIEVHTWFEHKLWLQVQLLQTAGYIKSERMIQLFA